MSISIISNPTVCFRPILFALNNDPKSEQPMIDFLVSKGLKYLGKQNLDPCGFSRENVFTYGDSNFRLVISWMRNLATIVNKPEGWDGIFTASHFDNIRECSIGYCDHLSLAFCYGEHEMVKIAIPNRQECFRLPKVRESRMSRETESCHCWKRNGELLQRTW